MIMKTVYTLTLHTKLPLFGAVIHVDASLSVAANLSRLTKGLLAAGDRRRGSSWAGSCRKLLRGIPEDAVIRDALASSGCASAFRDPGIS